MQAMNLANREGQRVPDVRFRYRENGQWKTLTTDQLFAGRNVIVFALPGAFTPTCSSTHLPRFNELAPLLRQHGIDEVVCIAVNDPFVMEQWARDQGCAHVRLLPDGNGAFTEGMGMLVDKSDLNFGRRSWRYAMLVRDRRIEKMFIEPQKDGDPFELSDADTMLHYLAPHAKKPDQLALLTRAGCEYCARARQQLDEAGCDYAEIELPSAIRSKALGALAGAQTTPQLFADGRLIGDSEAIQAYLDQRR